MLDAQMHDVIQELPSHSGHIRQDLILHQEKSRAHCTSVRSDDHSEDFISVPNSSQGTIGYGTVVFETLQGYASPGNHWPTTEPVMLMRLQAA